MTKRHFVFKEMTYAELRKNSTFVANDLCVIERDGKKIGSESLYLKRKSLNEAILKNEINNLSSLPNVYEIRNLHKIRHFEMANYADNPDSQKTIGYLREPEHKFEHSCMCDIDQIYAELELLDHQLTIMKEQATTLEERVKIFAFMTMRLFSIHPYSDGNKRLFHDLLENFHFKETGFKLYIKEWPGFSEQAIFAAVKGNNLGPLMRDLVATLPDIADLVDAKEFEGFQISPYKIQPNLVLEHRYTPQQELWLMKRLKEAKENWKPVTVTPDVDVALETSKHGTGPLCSSENILFRRENLQEVFHSDTLEPWQEELLVFSEINSVFDYLEECRLDGKVSAEREDILLRYAAYSEFGDLFKNRGDFVRLAVSHCRAEKHQDLHQEIIKAYDQFTRVSAEFEDPNKMYEHEMQKMRDAAHMMTSTEAISPSVDPNAATAVTPPAQQPRHRL